MGFPMLSYETLQEAVAGRAHAFRAVVDLDPAGGEGDKVFPPTYEGSKYAFEKRIIEGDEVDCVLLDSVQSQANRLELALLDWHRSCEDCEPPFPLVQIDFRETEAKEVGVLSVLEAPHRIADAFFLACEIEEDGLLKSFRHPMKKDKSSKIGLIVDEAKPANATGLFGLCPTALIFGMWDSHGARGGLGEKFQRILTSEIIGVGVTKENVRPASRLDPLIKVAGDNLPIKNKGDGTWEVAEGTKGTKDTKDKKDGKLAKKGLGNVTPSLEDKDKKRPNHGGTSIRYARQIVVLSLPALRRLRFPLNNASEAREKEEINVAARNVLAALALAALTRQWENGFSLRSRCDLVPKEEPALALLHPGGIERFRLPFERAAENLICAVKEAREKGLPWPTQGDNGPWSNGVLNLKPSKELVKAVVRSRELLAEQRNE